MRWPLLLPLLLLALAGCSPSRSPDAAGEDLGPVADFVLMDRSGREVRRDDLRGKVWVAAFIFTRCAGPCSQVSASMARLQHELANQPNVRLVTFTVDPEHDTAEVLNEYAERFRADPQRWLFLTTAERDNAKMHRLIREAFHEHAEDNRGEARTPGNEVMHSPRLVLVDRKGHIRDYFDGRQISSSGEPIDELPRLKTRIGELLGDNSAAGESLLPSVNACLNGLAAVLLVLGYLAIRGRRVVLHKVCMLTALAVSAVFLACYLYYHFAVKRGEPTRFPGEGWLRGVYFAVLGTHTVLAAIVAPLALVTAYLGLRDRLARHVWIARWTLPIWLYVSVSGVVVYWMLYRLYPAP